jgi:hypothetical protein
MLNIYKAIQEFNKSHSRRLEYCPKADLVYDISACKPKVISINDKETYGYKWDISKYLSNTKTVDDIIRDLIILHADEMTDLHGIKTGELVKTSDGSIISTALGVCHSIWAFKRNYLKEKYGIIWKSPAQRDPGTCYD